MNYGQIDYQGSICRPPMEQGAFILPVEDGCSHNKCSFCHFYKNVPFRLIPLDEVESELQRIHALNTYGPKRIFLGGGNAFALPTKHLIKILDMISHYFPECQEITSDATISDIRRKSDTELKELKSAGMGCLYVGLECGDDEALRHLGKDHLNPPAIEQLDRLNALTMSHGAHLMTGASGSGRAGERGLATAQLINRVKPESIINVSMFIDSRAPLQKEVDSGSFIPATTLEHLLEERALIENIQVPLNYDSIQIGCEVRILGTLPQDRERLLLRIDRAISTARQLPKSQKITPICADRRVVGEAYIYQIYPKS